MDMHTALRLRAEVDVKEWLKTHSVDLQDDQKQTLLHIAASEGLYDTASKLVKKGANVSAVDDRNWTPLHCAASGQMYDVCELLIHNKADVNANTKDGNTPAHYVVKGTSNPEGQTKVLDMLVQRNADLNLCNLHGETPLIRACLVGSELVAAFVLGCGANVNALNSLDESALHQAVRSGRPNLVALLLLAGADISLKNQSGKTPYDEAVELNTVDAKEILDAYKTNKEAACAVFRMQTAELGAAVSAFKKGNLQNFVPTYKASEEDFTEEVRDLINILFEEKRAIMGLQSGTRILEKCAKLDSIITYRKGKGSRRKSSYKPSDNTGTMKSSEAKAALLSASSSPKSERKSQRRTTVSLYMPTKPDPEEIVKPQKPERRTRAGKSTLGATVDGIMESSTEDVSASLSSSCPPTTPSPAATPTAVNPAPIPVRGRGRGRGGMMTAGRPLPEPGSGGIGRRPPNIRRESQDDITIGLSSPTKEKGITPPLARPRPPPKKVVEEAPTRSPSEDVAASSVDKQTRTELMAKLTAIHAGGAPPKLVEKSLKDSGGSAGSKESLSGSGGTGMSRRQKVVKGFKTLRASHVGSASDAASQGSPNNRRSSIAPPTPETPEAKPTVEEVPEAPVIHDPSYYLEQLHLPPARTLTPASAPAGATPEEKKLVSRKNSFVEIICTENQYVLQLGNVVAFYLKPLMRDYPDMISDEERSSIFSNIEHIFHISRDLLYNLEEEEKKPDQEQCIGAVFLKFIASLSYYKHYVTNFHEGMKTLDSIKNSNKAFSDYLTSILQREDAVREPLSNLLIRPFQRVCRYVLLIRELIKHVPEDWKDYADLQEAMDKIDKIVAEANETKRIMDNLMKLQEIEQSVVDWNVEIKQALKFIIEGEFKEADAKGHLEKRKFFLFNKMIIIVKPKSKGKCSMRMSAMLDDVMVWPMNDTGKVKNAFQIVSGSPGDRQAEKVTVCAKNAVEKENWINQINECISSTGAFDFIFD